MMYRRKQKGGFTLLELIIVIIVLGILAAMALPQFVRVAERGRVAKAKAVLDMVRKAEGIYYAVNTDYTDQDARLGAEVPELLNLQTAGFDADWTYEIVYAGPPPTYTATATRDTGEYVGNTLSIDQDGTWGHTHPLY